MDGTVEILELCGKLLRVPDYAYTSTYNSNTLLFTTILSVMLFCILHLDRQFPAAMIGLAAGEQKAASALH